MLARQTFCWGVEPGKKGRYVRYCPVLDHGQAASQRGGNTKQKQRRKRAKTGGTIKETGRYVAVYRTDFTAFPVSGEKICNPLK